MVSHRIMLDALESEAICCEDEIKSMNYKVMKLRIKRDCLLTAVQKLSDVNVAIPEQEEEK